MVPYCFHDFLFLCSATEGISFPLLQGIDRFLGDDDRELLESVVTASGSAKGGVGSACRAPLDANDGGAKSGAEEGR